jgi:hypothetical protein
MDGLLLFALVVSDTCLILISNLRLHELRCFRPWENMTYSLYSHGAPCRINAVLRSQVLKTAPSDFHRNPEFILLATRGPRLRHHLRSLVNVRQLIGRPPAKLSNAAVHSSQLLLAQLNQRNIQKHHLRFFCELRQGDRACWTRQQMGHWCPRGQILK